MKFIFIFLAIFICLSCYLAVRTDITRKAKTKESTQVSIIYRDSTAVTEEDTANRQIFDKGPVVHTWDFNYNGPSPAIDTVALGLCTAGDFNIDFAANYYRTAGTLSRASMIDEVAKSIEKPTHRPSLFAAIFYLSETPANENTPEEQVEVMHEFFEVCGSCANDPTRVARLVFDRDAIGKDSGPMWHSRVRIAHVPGTTCTAASNEWGHNRQTSTNKKYINIKGNVTPVIQTSLNGLIRKCIKYVKRYWRYNGIYNCQHFATNMFNDLTGSTLDMLSNGMMTVHSDASPARPKADWDLDAAPLVRTP